MNCKAFADKIPLFYYGEMNEEEKTAVSRHIENCAECRALLKTLENFSESGKIFRRQPPDFVLTRVQAHFAEKSTEIKRRTLKIRALELALGLSFAAFAVFMFLPKNKTADLSVFDTIQSEVSDIGDDLDFVSYELNTINYENTKEAV